MGEFRLAQPSGQDKEQEEEQGARSQGQEVPLKAVRRIFSHFERQDKPAA